MKMSLGAGMPGGGSGLSVPALDLNFLSGVLDGRISFTRSSSATRVNAQGLIETLGNDQPRFDHDPVTLAPKGLLIEEQRTNLLTYSQQLDNAAWTTANITITANQAVAPDGTMTADLVVDTATNGQHYLGRSSVSGAIPTNKSSTFVFIKRAFGSLYPQLQVQADSNSEQWTFDLEGLSAQRTFGSYFGFSESIQDIGNGWYKIGLGNGQASAGTTYRWFLMFADSYAGNNGYAGSGSGFYIWGAQLEAGAFSTSYIPTTSAQNTRLADGASIGGISFSNWFRPDEGSFLVQGAVIISGTRPYWEVQNTSSPANQQMYSAHNNRAAYVTKDGINQVDLSPNNNTLSNTIYRQAMTYKSNDFSACVSGGIVAADTSGAVPSVDKLQLGFTSAGGIYLNGTLMKLQYYRVKISNDHMKYLTSKLE